MLALRPLTALTFRPFFLKTSKVTDLYTIWDKTTKIALGDTSITDWGAYIDQSVKQASSPTFAGLTVGSYTTITEIYSNTKINNNLAGTGVIINYNTGSIKTSNSLDVFNGLAASVFSVDYLGNGVFAGGLTVGSYGSHYDSGWQSIGANSTVVLTHSLGTLNTIVLYQESANSDGSNAFLPDGTNDYWDTKTTTQITVHNGHSSAGYFRITMFKLT